jgi:hypothetical protein
MNISMKMQYSTRALPHSASTNLITWPTPGPANGSHTARRRHSSAGRKKKLRDAREQGCRTSYYRVSTAMPGAPHDRELDMVYRSRRLMTTLAFAAIVATFPLVTAHADNDWRHHGNWGGGGGWHRDRDWHGGGYRGYGGYGGYGDYGGYGGYYDGGGNFYFYGLGPSYYYPPPPVYYYPPPQAYYPPPQPYYAQPYYPTAPYYYGPQFGLQFSFPFR